MPRSFCPTSKDFDTDSYLISDNCGIAPLGLANAILHAADRQFTRCARHLLAGISRVLADCYHERQRNFPGDIAININGKNASSQLRLSARVMFRSAKVPIKSPAQNISIDETHVGRFASPLRSKNCDKPSRGRPIDTSIQYAAPRTVWEVTLRISLVLVELVSERVYCVLPIENELLLSVKRVF